MKSYSQYAHTVTFASVNSQTLPPATSDILLGSCILTFPMLVVLGVLGYRQHRSKLFQRQVTRLERVWHLPCETDSIKE